MQIDTYPAVGCRLMVNLNSTVTRREIWAGGREENYYGALLADTQWWNAVAGAEQFLGQTKTKMILEHNIKKVIFRKL